MYIIFDTLIVLFVRFNRENERTRTLLIQFSKVLVNRTYRAIHYLSSLAETLALLP